jgi:phage gpG-like protein
VAPETRLNQIASNYKLKFEPDSMREVVISNLGGQAESGKKQEHGKGSEEVRGTMSLNEISSKSGVPKDYILKKLRLPASINANIPAREWLHAHDKSMQDIRQAITEYRAEKKKQ